MYSIFRNSISKEALKLLKKRARELQQNHDENVYHLIQKAKADKEKIDRKLQKDIKLSFDTSVNSIISKII